MPREVAALGAGEILLTSMDRDGTRQGFDIALTRAVADAVSIPVIASGGVGNLDHLVAGIRDGHATAVLAASIFHFGEYSVRQAKDYMAAPACRCGSTRSRDLEWLENIFGGDDKAKVTRKSAMPTFTLHDLEQRVRDRAHESAEVSYTRKLLDRGITHCAKKLGEEAVEAAIAAVGEDKERMIAEAADVLYHLLVVLHARDITLDEVEAVLAARSRQSGLDEKASRKGA